MIVSGAIALPLFGVDGVVGYIPVSATMIVWRTPFLFCFVVSRSEHDNPPNVHSVAFSPGRSASLQHEKGAVGQISHLSIMSSITIKDAILQLRYM